MRSARNINKFTKVKIDSRKWDKIQKEVKKLKGAVTAIGLHSDATREDGSKQALIGFVNEFGTTITVTPKMRGYLHYIGIHLSPSTTTITIPERNWMRSWFDSHKAQINKVVAKLYGQVLDGKIDAKQALALLGAYAEGGIKKNIIELKTPANAPSTIRIKQSSNPLIDTGGMLNAVHHKEYFGGKKPE